MKIRAHFIIWFLSIVILELPGLANANSVFVLQLGSSETEQEAKSKWEALKDKNHDLSALSPKFPTVTLQPDNYKVVRTQAGPLPTRTEAAALCAKIRTPKQECFVVESALFAADTAPPTASATAQKATEKDFPKETEKKTSLLAPPPAKKAAAEEKKIAAEGKNTFTPPQEKFAEKSKEKLSSPAMEQKKFSPSTTEQKIATLFGASTTESQPDREKPPQNIPALAQVSGHPPAPQNIKQEIKLAQAEKTPPAEMSASKPLEKSELKPVIAQELPAELPAVPDLSDQAVLSNEELNALPSLKADSSSSYQPPSSMTQTKETALSQDPTEEMPKPQKRASLFGWIFGDEAAEAPKSSLSAEQSAIKENTSPPPTVEAKPLVTANPELEKVKSEPTPSTSLTQSTSPAAPEQKSEEKTEKPGFFSRAFSFMTPETSTSSASSASSSLSQKNTEISSHDSEPLPMPVSPEKKKSSTVLMEETSTPPTASASVDSSPQNALENKPSQTFSAVKKTPLSPPTPRDNKISPEAGREQTTILSSRDNDPVVTALPSPPPTKTKQASMNPFIKPSLIPSKTSARVDVAEAVRVPVSEDTNHRVETVREDSPFQNPTRISPSADKRTPTLWVSVGSFSDDAQALSYWDQASATHAEILGNLRVRVSHPLSAATHENENASLHIGPFEDNETARQACAVMAQDGLRCRLTRDLGGTSTAGISRERGYSRREFVSNTGDETTNAGGYWVQLGSYRSQAAAEDMWEDLKSTQKKILKSYQPNIQTPPTGSHTHPLYRLRTGPFATEYSANALCNSLEARGIDCLTVNEE